MKLYRTVPITGTVNTHFTENDMIYDRETQKTGIYFSSYPVQSLDMVCEYYHRNEDKYMFLSEYELTDDIDAIVGKYTHKDNYYISKQHDMDIEMIAIISIISIDNTTPDEILQFIIYTLRNDTKNKDVINNIQQHLSQKNNYIKYNLPEEYSTLRKYVFNWLKQYESHESITKLTLNPITNLYENHISASMPINCGRLEQITPDNLEFDGRENFLKNFDKYDSSFCENSLRHINRQWSRVKINKNTNKDTYKNKINNKNELIKNTAARYKDIKITHNIEFIENINKFIQNKGIDEIDEIDVNEIVQMDDQDQFNLINSKIDEIKNNSDREISEQFDIIQTGHNDLMTEKYNEFKKTDTLIKECDTIFSKLETFIGEVFIARPDDLKKLNYIKTSVIRAHDIKTLFIESNYQPLHQNYIDYLNNNCVSKGNFKLKHEEAHLQLQFQIGIKKGIISNLEYEREKM